MDWEPLGQAWYPYLHWPHERIRTHRLRWMRQFNLEQHVTPSVFYTMTMAMTSVECATLPTQKSLRSEPAFADSYTVQMAVFNIKDSVQNLPYVKTVSPALQSAILGGHHMPVIQMLLLLDRVVSSGMGGFRAVGPQS